MPVVTYSPGCVVSWTSHSTAGTAPVRLPRVLHADTVLSLAPSVGTANLVIDDPDGRWAATIKPNDGINVTFTSRAGGAKNLGSLYPGAASAWSGLVNSAVPAYDPRSQYGRAVKISASTFWKPLVTTSVPLEFFFNAQYPQPGVALQTLFSQAVFACEQNLGGMVSIGVDMGALSVPIATSVTNVPSEMDVNDPQSQSWAAYLMNLLTAGGTESYAREDGTLIVRDFQGMQNPAVSSLLTLPTGEIFSSSGGGVSDENLTTNAIVSWSNTPLSNFAAAAPAGGLGNIGPLPPQLLDGNGNPLPQIGRRFASYTADFLNAQQDAERYASNVRSVGLANVDQFQAAVALNGDVRIGTCILVPCYNRRYYVTTVGHYFEDQLDCETNITGRFGVPPGYVWNQAAMAGASQINLNSAGPIPSGGGPATRPANLPAPANPQDPDVRWLSGMAVIAVPDIARILQAAGSPFADQAAFIWTDAQKYGVNPAFALAVWQEECWLGTNPNAVTDLANHNPGSLGVASAAGGGTQYATWQAGIDAWFQTLAGRLYLGAGLIRVGQIAAVYDPANAASWQQNVAQLMGSYIASAQLPAVQQPTGAVAPPSATGSMGAAAAYAGPLAQSIPANASGIHNVLQPRTALGAFVGQAGYGTVQCTAFQEYLIAKIAKIAGIVGTDGTITNGPNAAQWGSYLANLGFTNVTSNGPLPGDVLLFSPGEVDPKTGASSDLSEGDGHVGTITAVSQPDGNNQGGSITLASANTTSPVDTWTLTKDPSGNYVIGGLTGGRFFGATPFAWWRVG